MPLAAQEGMVYPAAAETGSIFLLPAFLHQASHPPDTINNSEVQRKGKQTKTIGKKYFHVFSFTVGSPFLQYRLADPTAPLQQAAPPSLSHSPAVAKCHRILRDTPAFSSAC